MWRVDVNADLVGHLIIGGIVSLIVGMVLSLLKIIRDMNGSIKSLNQWKEDHEKLHQIPISNIDSISND